ncbi:hypothetical protein VTN31DRAFT_4149 [Thermomyces dupontii]|uniref:uncharacterized protein n=1 Tax=Talaromyces thermophilus TaxID=28565 RepID=UPI0037432B63
MSNQSMPDEDLDAIGRNCDYQYCRQLDFLPFRCASCGGTFCLQHRTEAAHECQKAGEWGRRRLEANIKPTTTTTTTTTTTATSAAGKTGKPCAKESCKTRIDTATQPAVHCDKCNRSYCLAHRLPEEHACSTLKPSQPTAAATTHESSERETLRKIFERLKTSSSRFLSSGNNNNKSSRNNTSTTSNSAASRIAQLNQLRREAKGDPCIPPDRRIYLHVVGTANNGTADKPPEAKLYFDTRWKVGRVLDDAARRLRVENLNNRVDGEAQRLRLFHVEGGRFLEFSEAIADGVANGNTIVMLRGAGAPR